MSRHLPRPSFEARIAWWVFASGLPGSVTALWLLWSGDVSLKVRWTLTVLILVAWLGVAAAIRDTLSRPLQRLANLLLSLREGDYTLRAKVSGDDALSLAHRETNALADALREGRLGEVEANALLGRVMTEVDVAILAFDAAGKVQLANRAAERLFGKAASQLSGATAASLGVPELLEGSRLRRLERTFPGGAGTFELRRSEFRQGGVPHQLVVLTDVQRALREEEREAWKRLIRVLGHEINNSLAPIRSLAGSLRARNDRADRGDDWEQDVASGLAVIERRAEALGRFMTAYARLARLPPPRLEPVDLDALIRRVLALEKHPRVREASGPAVRVQADPDQLEQALINLVRNAAEAASETGGAIEVHWTAGPEIEVRVEDEGPGVAQTSNLFVPFFTTKPQGSGIGLALSRQIAEAHGGRLTLENRAGGRGAVARLVLPMR